MLPDRRCSDRAAGVDRQAIAAEQEYARERAGDGDGLKPGDLEVMFGAIRKTHESRPTPTRMSASISADGSRFVPALDEHEQPGHQHRVDGQVESVARRRNASGCV
jgi:hypothetical protein